MAVIDKTVIIADRLPNGIAKKSAYHFWGGMPIFVVQGVICSTHICKHLEVEKALFYVTFKA